MKKHVILLAFGCLTTLSISSRSPITTISGKSIQNIIDKKTLPKISKNGALDLTNINLTSLDGLQNIPNKKRIKYLYLGKNKLMKLPPNIFKGFTNLMWLNLNDNNLETLPPGIFKDLKKLRTLHLERNPLRNGEEEKISAEVKKSAPACMIYF